MRMTPRARTVSDRSPDSRPGTHECVLESPDAGAPSATDQATLSRCFTKKTLCHWLDISTRTWDRSVAAGLTPAPDLVVGSSPRWSPSSIDKWLRTHPRLPGRGKGVTHGTR
jgi:hypothetical protein